MIQELTVTLPKPHPYQLQILSQAKRFNVLSNGRRWGKSTLSLRLVKPAITDKWKIGYWNATYKDLEETWTELKSRLQPIILRKQEQLKKIELIGGGTIDMWSMDDPDSGRGFRYHRAIMDEFAKAKHGEYAWEKTIRATLTDWKGDAWFLSTPKGINSYFYTLFQNEKKFDNWKSWQMPTITNPYLDPDEIRQAELQLDPITFQQEYLAEFVKMADHPFFYCFEDKHIDSKAIYVKGQTVYLSFDFNVNPSTCILGHHNNKYIHIFDEIFLHNSSINDVCYHIKSKYPDAHFMITGDRSGMNRTGLNRSMNYYKIIKDVLSLKDGQFKIPSNPLLKQNIVLCNSLLANLPEIYINPICKELIYDMRFIEWDGERILKDDRNKREQQADMADCFRYYLNTHFHWFIK